MNFSIADLFFTGNSFTDSSGKLLGQSGESANDFRVLLENILKKNAASPAVSSSFLPPKGLLTSLAPLLAQGNLSLPGNDIFSRIHDSIRIKHLFQRRANLRFQICHSLILP